jgi:hypothetical protein
VQQAGKHRNREKPKRNIRNTNTKNIFTYWKNKLLPDSLERGRGSRRKFLLKNKK